MQFIGIDLHANKFTCCCRDGTGGEKKTAAFDRSEQGFANFYRTLTTQTYVPVEAAITAFAFARLIQPLVKEAVAANAYELKQTSLARKNTDKIDADILCRILKMQVLSGEQAIPPAVVPPVEIQELRALFSTCRLCKKQTAQIKNRIHALLKEKLYGFTQERRETIRGIENGGTRSFQINELFDTLEYMEARIKSLQDKIKEHAEPFMREIGLLTSMKGVSVFIATAVIAGIIKAGRFKNSKAFASYVRSTPRVSNSNTTVNIKGTNKKGRKLSSALLAQPMSRVLNAGEKLNKRYSRLTQYKKAGLVRSALRRRILSEMYQMLKKGEYHYGREGKKHEAKMRQYKNFLEKRKNLVKTA
jgi:transposase